MEEYELSRPAELYVRCPIEIYIFFCVVVGLLAQFFLLDSSHDSSTPDAVAFMTVCGSLPQPIQQVSGVLGSEDCPSKICIDRNGLLFQC